jgi:hypothetical protein
MSDPVLIALIITIPPTIVGIGQIYLGFKLSTAKKEIRSDVKELHKDVNGRMDQLLEQTAIASRAEGVESTRKDDKP